MKDLIFIIPVRLGSSRIYQKPLLKFGKETLLSHKIKQLLEVTNKENIVVSTNSQQLISIANKFKVNIHNRAEWLCQNHISTVSDQVVNVIKEINLDFNHFSWTLITSPLMKVESYLKCIEFYKKYVIDENKNDSLMTVNLIKEFLWDDNGPINYKCGKKHSYTQDLPNIYRVTNSINMISKKLALKNKYYLGKNPYKYILSKVEGIDIDNYCDYEIAKKLM